MVLMNKFVLSLKKQKNIGISFFKLPPSSKIRL